jgi:radical SAM protein (TIGR01212 family)
MSYEVLNPNPCLTTETLKLRLSVKNSLSRAVENVKINIEDIFGFGGYDFSVFLKAYKLLKDRNIRVCIHIINGLMNETKEDMINTAKEVAKLKPDAVKIHLLHIVKGTAYEKLYREDKLTPMTKDAYIDIVCRQLELLPQETVIERITGDGGRDTLVAPLWSLDKISVLGAIDKEMAARNTCQGINSLD